MANRYSHKRIVGVALALILALGAFLRLSHFGDWLHFELDQARDVKVIDAALDGGIGQLPLLGPRAGGTFLRLGPAFYYLEYISAVIFGKGPVGVGVIIPILSVLSIGVFFLLMRRYFARWMALWLTLLFSVSAFLVVYARFAWNPNPLPFFLLLGFYALLRAADVEEAKRTRWFLTAVVSLGLATHLHFIAFVALPAIVSVFLVFKRPRFSWKVWAGAGAIVIFLYAPAILNDITTGGANAQEFLQAVRGKSNKEHHTLAESVFRNTVNQATGFWMMTTGYSRAEWAQMRQIAPLKFDLTCDSGCQTYRVPGTMAVAMFGLGVLLLLVKWWKETVTRKKDFLFLSLLWFGACFALFTPLAYDFAPRFLLLVIPFPFLFLGLVLASVHDLIGRKRLSAFVVSAILLTAAISNFVAVRERFGEWSRASYDNMDLLPDRFLKEKTRVTLEQQEKLIDYMEAAYRSNGFPVYLTADPEYRRGLKYLAAQRGFPNDTLPASAPIYAKGNYFLIYRSQADFDRQLIKYAASYEVIAKELFGTLTLIQLQPKPEAVTAEIQDFSRTKTKGPSAAPDRFTWKQWWEKQGKVFDDGEDDEGME